MKHTTSESDVTSLSASSPPRTPKSPKRPAYYVQSPSHDDGDKSSTSHTTPVYNNSPLESPSHPSTGRHSRISSATRYSGFLRSSSSPASRKRLNDSSASAKGWREIDAIDEESAGYDDLEEERPKLCVMAFWFSVLVLVFTMVCLIVWGAARHYKPTVIVKSLTVHNFYVGEGTDRTGVPTKLVTLNCSLHINVHNPSTMFGIHFNKFYQPRTSTRLASVVLHGDKTPLYGAGATLDLSNTGAAVPLTLELAVRTRGYVIGKLVRVSHVKHVKCPVAIQSGSSKPVRFGQSACSYT
ncbi:hypothetical protein PR202_gb27220 [Eleusine coracana subsp. coracana]|uniref:Late embryogenesis abundant protein LEA-2 subgroup domain-containing protein n=1 Tax=Eleusine coracana subsp. coracana TaxID=191504 RepID=A0AAV5FUS1_ELECO|nr:hypothetical protein PR202_gb27220 [Eleusine coracana subsp. coracana]